MTTPKLSSLQRLRAVHESGLLDQDRDPAYDRLTRLTAQVLDTPISLLTVLDTERQFFVADHGLDPEVSDARGTPLSHSLCQHVIERSAPFVVDDSDAHPLVAGGPAATDLGVAAYLGVPFRAPGGEILGALCAIDTAPRAWTNRALAVLADVGALAASEVASRARLERADADLGAAAARLGDHEALTTLLFHQSPFPMALVGSDGFRIAVVNEAFERLTEHAEPDLVGRPLTELEGPGGASIASVVGRVFLASKSYDGVLRTAGGGLRHVHVTSRPVTIDGASYAVLTAEDTTAQHAAAAQHAEREALLRLAVEAAQFGAWSTDLQTGETYWDTQSRSIFGVAPDVPASAELGRSLVHPDDRAATDDAFTAALADPDGRYRNEKRLVRPDGTTRWVLTVGQILRDGKGTPSQIVGLAADVTERKRAEQALRKRGASLEREVAQRTEALRQRSDQARALAATVSLAEQRERHRIAHVLHEDLQQILFGASLHLGADRVGPAQESGPSGVERAAALIEQALDVTRALSHGLAAPGPVGGRVDRALRWIADAATAIYGLAVDATDLDEVEVAPEVCDACVQIVREALANVSKHAGVAHATLTLRTDGDEIEVVVADGGVGYATGEPDKGRRPAGYWGLQERAELFGGHVSILSAPGEGTRVRIRLPRAG